VLAASIRRRLAAMYEISGTLSDDLADADPARGEMSNVAAALVLLASSPARTEETDDMQRHALRVADRRLVLAALSGVAILLLWGIAAGARSLHREQARAAMQLAQMAYASGDHESVVAILKPVDSGRDAGAEFILGKALFKLGRIEEAERAFRAVEAMDPRLGSAWYNHALCLYEQGRMVEAIRAYENVQEQFATAQPDLVERASMAVTAIKGRIATH
jgi:Flp pilus assembly protein TadD